MAAPLWLPAAKQMAIDGKTYEQIGIELGLSRNTVCKAMVRHKANIEVQAHKREEQETPPWAERAKAMREAGASWKTIMREFGLSFRTLATAIDQNYSERRARENLKYMQSGGYAARIERERKANEAAQAEARERPRSSARELIASRFHNYRDGIVRYGK